MNIEINSQLIQQYVDNILEIPETTNYWLVRADGGKYYHDFLNNDFIATSNDEVTLDRLNVENALNFAGITVDTFKKIYADIYKDKKPQQISHAASRIYSFICGIKVNDLVLVPSQRSTEFIIGIVTSDVYEATQEEINKSHGDHYSICPYIKRRKVKWLKTVKRESISEKMYWILSAHQSIFNLNEHADHVDKLLSPVYIKGNQCFAILKVHREQGINVNDWLELYGEVKNISKEDSSDIIIKNNVQSPGLIDFVTDLDNLRTLVWCFVLLSGVFLTKVKVGKLEVLGIIPYFLNEGKINRESMRLDNEMKKVELEKQKVDLEKQKIEMKTPPIVEKLKITPFTTGKVVEFRTQMDNLDPRDENESERK
ncbi:hypothetical protein M3689_05850 [Alkalihalophilus marmarensis]|uniref:hypothetical protein n=1 Tax=Alkalihalophilus marmarensis TaxID=521377 RepID=UPI00203C8921|nr:hypothetical protein [Alkalihalophilus marmarensis]MCM3488829.1 hypothetical protein [Alkalihalophilus marmarensis]